MDITNISSDTYVFIGGRPLSPDNMIHFDDAEYGDERLRHEINALYSDGKITVANAPAGFPIADSTGSDGGSQSLQLLGPYTVGYDTINTNNGIVDLGPLDEGMIIINAWMYGEETFAQDNGNPTDGGEYDISIDTTGGGSAIAEYRSVSAGVGGWSEPSAVTDTRVFKRVVTVPANARLSFLAFVGTGGDHFIAGVATIYLLAYTP